MTLTFESVDEILWCDHSNESSLPVLSHCAICFSKRYKMKFANLVEICLWLHLAVKGLIKSDDYYSGMFPLPRWRTRGNGRTWWTRWTRGNRRTRRDWRPWAIRGASGNGRNARLAMKKKQQQQQQRQIYNILSKIKKFWNLACLNHCTIIHFSVRRNQILCMTFSGSLFHCRESFV